MSRMGSVSDAYFATCTVTVLAVWMMCGYTLVYRSQREKELQVRPAGIQIAQAKCSAALRHASFNNSRNTLVRQPVRRRSWNISDA